MAPDLDLTFAIRAVDKASSVVDKVGGKLKGLKAAIGPAFLAVGAVAGAAAIAVGVALFKIGSDFETAFNIIKVGTGASGEALEGLKDDFKDVFKSIPTDMKTAAGAVADWNTLLGATGETVQTLAKDSIEAARLMGVDSAELIDKAAKAYNVFGLSAEESTGIMDKFFVISQNTGIPLTKLTKNLQTFGPIMANAGFTIEETALFFGDLNKAGVDASRIMPALNSFTRKLAAEGITDLKGATIDMIEQIRNAETDTGALNLATEAFGAEGAQRMTNAIREGALSMDDLVASLDGSEGAIQRTAESTRTLGQRFTIMKNQALVAIEPLATGFLIVLQDLADIMIVTVIPAVGKFGAILGELKDIFVATINQDLQELHTSFVALPEPLQRVGVVVMAVARVFRDDLIPAAKEIAAVFMEDVLPVMKAVGIGLIQEILIPALKQYVQLWTGFIGVLIPVVALLADKLIPIFKKVVEVMMENKIAVGIVIVALLALFAPTILIIGAIVLVLAKWDEIREMMAVTIPGAINNLITKVEEIPIIGEIFKGVIDAIVLLVTVQFEIIKNVIETTIEAVINLVQFWMAIFKGDWDQAWTEAKELVSGIWNGIRDHIELVLGLVLELIKLQLSVFVQVILDAVPLMLQAGKDIIQGLFDGMTDVFVGLLAWVTALPGKVLGAIKGGFGIFSPSSQMASIGAEILLGLLNGMVGGIGAMLSVVREIPGKIIGVFVAPAQMLWGIGTSIIAGLAGSIRNGVFSVAGAIGSVVDGAISSAKSGFGIFNPSRVFMDIGGALTDGLSIGIEAGLPEVDFSIAKLVERFNSLSDGARKMLAETTDILDVFAANGVHVFEDFSAILGQIGKDWRDLGSIINDNPIVPPPIPDPTGDGGGGGVDPPVIPDPGGGGVPGVDPNTKTIGHILHPWESQALAKVLDVGLDFLRNNVAIWKVVQWLNEMGGDAVISALTALQSGSQFDSHFMESMLNDLRKEGLSFLHGGIIPAGVSVNADLHGPEAIIPLNKIGGMGLGGITVNGPLIQHTGPLMGDAIEARNFARLIVAEVLRLGRGS